MTNSDAWLGNAAQRGISLLGTLSILIAAYKWFMFFVSKNKQQNTIVLPILLTIFGGLCLAGGFGWFTNTAKDTKTTIDELGGASIVVPYVYRDPFARGDQ